MYDRVEIKHFSSENAAAKCVSELLSGIATSLDV
jgi:hypothetical protein